MSDAGHALGDVSTLKRSDFDVVGQLGEGSVGIVLKVVHRASGFTCALKAVNQLRIKEHDLGDQLLREAAAQGRARHDNLLRCFGYFEDEDMFYLVLEYAAGGDLYRHLKRHGPLPELTAKRIFSQVVAGVRYLHELRPPTIHRDLKPENILLSGGLEGEVKICDFGWCAQAAGRTTFCGTLCMLAPEMLEGLPYDSSVDVWALGVLLYEMLTGNSPFDAGGGLMKTCENIVSKELSEDQLDAVPEECRSLVLSLLEKDPTRRPTLAQISGHVWLAPAVAVAEGSQASCAAVVATSSQPPMVAAALATPPVSDGGDLGGVPATSDLLVPPLSMAGCRADRPSRAEPACAVTPEALVLRSRGCLMSLSPASGVAFPPESSASVVKMPAPSTLAPPATSAQAKLISSQGAPASGYVASPPAAGAASTSAVKTTLQPPKTSLRLLGTVNEVEVSQPLCSDERISFGFEPNQNASQVLGPWSGPTPQQMSQTNAWPIPKSETRIQYLAAAPSPSSAVVPPSAQVPEFVLPGATAIGPRAKVKSAAPSQQARTQAAADAAPSRLRPSPDILHDALPRAQRAEGLLDARAGQANDTRSTAGGEQMWDAAGRWFDEALNIVGFGPQAAQDALPPEQQVLAQQVEELGFPKRRAIEAAKRTSTVEAAVEWLLKQEGVGA